MPASILTDSKPWSLVTGFGFFSVHYVGLDIVTIVIYYTANETNQASLDTVAAYVFFLKWLFSDAGALSLSVIYKLLTWVYLMLS